jgi:hypothetical protein
VGVGWATNQPQVEELIASKVLPSTDGDIFLSLSACRERHFVNAIDVSRNVYTTCTLTKEGRLQDVKLKMNEFYYDCTCGSIEQWKLKAC